MIFTGREELRTTEGHVTRHDLQCVAPTRYSRVRCEGVVFFLALFLLLFTHSWGSCSEGCGNSSGVCWANSFVADCSGGGSVSCSDFSSSGSYYTGAIKKNQRQYNCNYNNCRSFGCDKFSGYITIAECDYTIRCSSQAEADSVVCVNEGKYWVNGECKEVICDSTKWECQTTTERTQTTIASDNVTCFGGDCFGGVYCEYVTKNTTTCTNECGGSTTQENSIPIRYEGACNPDNLTDDDECTGVRCISFAATKSFSLYMLCKSREIVNGEQKFLPRMVGGGYGNCASNGYPETNDSTGFAGSQDSTNIPESCFTMGMGCPPPDTTNYASGDNRTPQNGCNCEPYDGLSSVSRIVCPDGSISLFMGSCDTWKEPPFSSSSTEPPESSSGSQNPTSSGGALVGDWANYSQGQEIIGLLGAIASNTMQKPETKNINTINVALDDYATSREDVDVSFSRHDSIYNPSYVVDTAGLKNAIFGRVTEENTILDTLEHPVSKCPCFTFFSSGGNQAQITGTHISLPKMVFDFADFHGFDLCRIISVIVSALASVVAFFIGFSIFKNVSQ